MQNKIQSYEIIEIIGHGGMGIVYKARHEFRKEIVVIKTLHPQYALDPELRKRFKNEASILNNLDHPNIVKVLDFIEEPDSLNIVMEYAEGRTLDKIIGEEVGPIPYEKALILFEQILNGVSYAHQNGVIHRDLKPGNIIITKDNKVKITDFGIAKIEGGGSHTKTGTKMGTLYYMSPEQLRGQRVDERTDIYSLGITLYEMLAGRLPFERKEGASDFAIMNQIVNEEIKDPRNYYPYIPKELVRLIYRAIVKDKERRISSVNNFIDEIKLIKEEIKQAIRESKSESIRENEQSIKITETRKKEPAFINDMNTGFTAKRKNKTKIILGLSLATLVIIAFAWLLLPLIISELSAFKTVKIGEQTWMAENLNVDHYRNGDQIPEVEAPEQWKNLKSGAWCYYENKTENGKYYGKLYNWYAVNDPRGLAPKGWHIPTSDEFEILEIAVNNNGNSLKAAGQGIGAGAGTNTSGFSALLAGCRGSTNGNFANLNFYTFFWSSTENSYVVACTLDLNGDGGGVALKCQYAKENGISVRCVKDEKSTNQLGKNLTEQVNDIYKTAKIGEQTWMAENLNADHYRNGDQIPEVENPEQWKNLKSGAWCYYENKTENGKYYGKLYNWYAVNDYRGLAPEGWHIPTQSEFETLKASVNNDGNALKAIGQGNKAGGGTNTNGFSALLAGARGYEGHFLDLGSYTPFWSSTNYNTATASYLFLIDENSSIGLTQFHKECGFSVRCVKDEKSTNQSGKNLTEQVKDIYKTVNIGVQTWMEENLNVDHYRNGDPIPEVQGIKEWSNLKSGAWCYYENKPENGKYYGKLYNWYAVNDPRGLAPEGWHIPTQTEFETLEASVNNNGNALKAIGQGSRTGAGTNTSGFSALLAGARGYTGHFADLGSYTPFWSSTRYTTTAAYYLFLIDENSSTRLTQFHKECGFSVRCVKD